MMPHPSSTGGQTLSIQSRALGIPDRSSMALPSAQSSARPLIDLSAPNSGYSETEHPTKRVRVDTNVSGVANDGRTLSSRSADLRSADVRTTSTSAGTINNSRPFTVSSRARPAYSFQELVADTYGTTVLAGNVTTPGPQTSKPPSPPPFPVRPWSHTSARQTQDTQEGFTSHMRAREVQTTPYRQEVPEIAPVLTRDKVADYSPWSRLGNHPEDRMSDLNVKAGNFDRVPGVNTNSDIQSHASKLSNHLKNQSSLQLLSSVFAAALEKRQVNEKISSVSTFKPPPRVTLTDNKREAWLRDLANPSVPLRRLSRTIPHGIRGKLLLDQCLGKMVPIGRAVWLAKCVGANEIRAFKRKGTSGSLSQGLETKWVREWTLGVQQFVVGVIKTCGKSDWRNQMAYAVRLAARLFHEHLLDQDCYLDWYLSSMETASLDGLPVWLAMLNIYWTSLVRYRKRGRRLAEILLEKLRDATLSDLKAHLKPLVDRISFLVHRICRDHSPCLILPRSWKRYQDVVASSLDAVGGNATLQSLILRNSRVQRPTTHLPVRQRSPQEQVIALLDASCDTHDVPLLSENCLDLIFNRQDLVSVLLKWATSPFRRGLYRVYIAVRLLRKWKRSGVDIDAGIFWFLTRTTSLQQSATSMTNLYHILVELVRSQTFSVGRCLQWLVARGAVEQYRQQESPSTVPIDIALLSHIPTTRLPQHLLNLRDTLMMRAGLTSPSPNVLLRLKATLKESLPDLFGEDDFPIAVETDQNEIPWSVKADISQWIRSAVSQHYEKRPACHMDLCTDSREVSSLTQEEFVVVRAKLEQYEDLSMLADVLSDASHSDNVYVLTCAVDTLNHHSQCFAVIGALEYLFRSFYEAFLRVKAIGHPLCDLAYSMAEVAQRLPGEANSLILLRQEVSRADRNVALAACSPVSDHMAGTLNDANPSFNEDMDHFLSSGNSMDEGTMVLVFQKLIQQLAFSGDKDWLIPATVCRHLVQLRSFNAKHFDLLLVQWLDATLISSSRPKLSSLLYPLAGIGCVTLPAFTNLVMKIVKDETQQTDYLVIQDLLVEFLELLIPKHHTKPVYDFYSYRFRIAQDGFLNGHSHELLSFLKETLPRVIKGTTQDVVTSFPSVVSLLGEIILRNPEDNKLDDIGDLMKTHPIFRPFIRKCLDYFLDDDQQCSSNAVQQTASTLQKADHLSLPLCQMKLQILFDANIDSSSRNDMLDLIYKSAVGYISAGQSFWLDLVKTTGQEAAEQLRQRAEKDFFSVTQSEAVLGRESETESLNCQKDARIYLALVDGLAYSIPEEGVPSLAPILVEKMNSVLQKLFAMHVEVRNCSEQQFHGSLQQETSRALLASEEKLIFWLTSMLQMIRIHRAAFDLPVSTGNQRLSAYIDLSRLLIIVCCLALSRTPFGLTVQPRMDLSASSSFALASSEEVRTGNTIQTYALDMASSLVDSLSDEARQHCANFIKERFPATLNCQNDPRLQYLFGPVADGPPTAIGAGPASSAPVSSPAASTLTTPSANPVNAAIPQTGNTVEDPSSIYNRLRVQSRARIVGSYPVRPWEMLEEAAPVVGTNDTAIDLNLFNARKVRDS